MRRIALLLAVSVLLAAVLVSANGPAYDEIEKGVRHTKRTIKGLGPIAHKDTPERRRIDKLKGHKYHEAHYHHAIQETDGEEVDTVARAIIDNPTRQAAKEYERNAAKFTKTVTSAHGTLVAHNKKEAARKAGLKRTPKPAALLEVDVDDAAAAEAEAETEAEVDLATGVDAEAEAETEVDAEAETEVDAEADSERRRFTPAQRRAIALRQQRHRAALHQARARAQAQARARHQAAVRAHAIRQQQLRARRQQLHARKLAAHRIRSLKAINHSWDTYSAQKIAKLTAPKIEYYHAVQKVSDRDADLAARSVIDTPEREAYRQQKAADVVFAKTVSSASSLLKAHNAFERHPAEART